MTNSVEPPSLFAQGAQSQAAGQRLSAITKFASANSIFSLADLGIAFFDTGTALYDRKYVFYLSSYRRLLMLRFLCSPLPACRQLLDPRWLAILLVSDFFALLVPNDGILPLFRPDISAVSV